MGDVNGDGYPDLIVPGSLTTYNVLLGSSTGTYNIASTIQVPASISLFGKTITGASASSLIVCGRRERRRKSRSGFCR